MVASSELYRIFASYIENVKPLLRDIKEKRGKLPDNLLNEVRALNDHIARCYREDNSNVPLEITKAKGHLTRLQLDCFKELNVIFHKKYDSYERLTYSSMWLRIDNGNFWRSYFHRRQTAYTAVLSAKLIETLNVDNSLKHYEMAYQNNIELDKLFKKHKWKIRGSFFVRIVEMVNRTISWIVITFLLSAISTMIQVHMSS